MKRKINEFPDIDTSKMNIDENGNVLRGRRIKGIETLLFDDESWVLLAEYLKLKDENDKLILGNKSLSEKVVSVTKEKLDLQKENKELRDKYLQATDEGTSFAHLKMLERENEILAKRNCELQSDLDKAIVRLRNFYD